MNLERKYVSKSLFVNRLKHAKLSHTHYCILIHRTDQFYCRFFCCIMGRVFTGILQTTRYNKLTNINLDMIRFLSLITEQNTNKYSGLFYFKTLTLENKGSSKKQHLQIVFSETKLDSYLLVDRFTNILKHQSFG